MYYMYYEYTTLIEHSPERGHHSRRHLHTAIVARMSTDHRDKITGRKPLDSVEVEDRDDGETGSLSVMISKNLLERCRDAVAFCSRDGMTVRRFTERALSDYLRRLETTRNDGEPFPEREHDLQPGRPIGPRS